jgi:redox-sensitive bicupin YhaK (pirin superfamily)
VTVKIIRKDDQATGSFDGGAILEHKPVGFPGEGGRGRPVSSLLYWAHAWSDRGGLIAEHPHEGFEILSYVLKGEIEHYDSRLRDWKRLAAGAAQIIRAGSGITHAERLLPGAAIFQIWFDPDLSKSLSRPASYDDYPKAAFPVRTEEGVETTVVKGTGSPLRMETPGVLLEDQRIAAGPRAIPVAADEILLATVIEGTPRAGGAPLAAGDCVLARGGGELAVAADSPWRWFAIRLPASPGYRTWAAMHGRAAG